MNKQCLAQFAGVLVVAAGYNELRRLQHNIETIISLQVRSR